MRRFAGWALLAVIAWFVANFLHGTALKYQGSDPDAFALFFGREGWLYTHLAGGALTLVLGLPQLLWQRLHVGRPVHRWTGRLYLLGMAIACVGAVGLITTSPAPAAIRIAFAATTLVWVATALVAVAAVLRGRLATHRVWMIRNYLVALAPVTFRLLLLPSAVRLGIAPSPGVIALLLWLGWAVPLAAFEVARRVPGVRDAGPSIEPRAA